MKTKKTKTALTAKATLLSMAVALSMSNMASANDDYKQIGDLEIYKAPEGGSITITMMLDISGSMQNADSICTNSVLGSNTTPGTVTYHLKDEAGAVINEITKADGTKLDVSKGVKLINYGFIDGSGRKRYCAEPVTRMEKLKQAMLSLISQEGLLSNDIKLGVGTFPTRGYWYTGQISVPAKPLTREQRWELMKYISTLVPVGSTPSAQAYVEAGAYMLGTTTARLGAAEKRVVTVGSMDVYNRNSFRLLYCGSASFDYTSPGVVAKPTSVSFNGSALKWYTCNDGSDRQFPSFDFDMVTQSSSWLGTIIPNRMSRMDFGLLPDFDVVWGPGYSVTSAFPATAMTNATVPRNPEVWKNSYGQFASPAYHFGQIIDYRIPSVGNSGFPLSASSTKKADGETYQSPAVTQSGDVGCDGYGIYFLTDGEPNGANNDARRSANLSLGINDGSMYRGSSSEFPNGSYGSYGYWGMIGAYAKDLREKRNPLNIEIKTATVGFGSVFTPAGGTPTTTKTIEGAEVKVTDCAKLEGVDAQNLCRWGERGYGYGEGGFLATSEPEAVSRSVVEFAETLNHTIASSPAGTISIPADPLSANSLQPYAYLPMLQPEMKKAATVWEGNLKKYHTLRGTLYGKGADEGARLYALHARPTEGNGNFPFALNPNAQDLWQKEASQADNTLVSVGGTRSQLVHPDATNKANVRSVFVETTVNGARQLQKVGTDGTRLIDFDKLGAEYTVYDKAYILNFLGYAVPVDESSYENAATLSPAEANRQLTEKLKTATFHSKPMLGGVLHSPPVLASYSGQLDTTTGNITNDESQRDDFLLYGSMDGALHLVSARTGTENFSFIPRQMFDDASQRHALLPPDSTHQETGKPKFGVDAPWQTDATYAFGKVGDTTSMRATTMFAYGGLRMGGVGLYGLNITNRDNPTLAFSINKNTAGFSRLGQTWTKPVVATIKTGSGSRSATNTKRVLFVSGGYDMCYENPAFKLNDSANKDTNCANKSMADGNAIYMIDAESGALLQTWTTESGSGASSGLATSSDDRQHMKHSIVGEVVALDRNSNGFVDSLYFADLGGQIFRIDLQEEVPATGSALTRRVVRVFDANAGMPNSHLPYRFYDKPVVSFYDQPNGRIAVVNASTGDRSSPLHKRRAVTDANRIYGIIDRDLATPTISAGRGVSGLITRNLTNATLNYYNPAVLEGNAAESKRLIDDLRSGKKQGWYYEMNRFSDRIGVKNLKSVGPGAVIGSVYYASIYSPEYQYNQVGSCSAQIAGGTERQGYCLPWGICANPNTGALSTKNGTVGYAKVGPGIQELAVATLTNEAGKSRNVKTLIGTQTFEERITAKSQGDTGGSGDPFATAEVSGEKNGAGSNPKEEPIVSATNKVLKVKRWYDLQTAEDDQ